MTLSHYPLVMTAAVCLGSTGLLGQWNLSADRAYVLTPHVSAIQTRLTNFRHPPHSGSWPQVRHLHMSFPPSAEYGFCCTFYADPGSYSKISSTILSNNSQSKSQSLLHGSSHLLVVLVLLNLLPLPTYSPNPDILQELTDSSVLHHSDSNVQSHDIQPLEQGCDCSIEKTVT